MKFIIKKEVLLNNLLDVAKAISNKNLIPILSGIKFELTEEGLYLLASDNDITIKTFIKKNNISKIEEVGTIVISGKYIVEIIKKLPSEDIKIEVLDGTKVKISTKSSEFCLNSFNPNEYPNITLEDSKNPVVIDKMVFRNIINQTSYATSLQETRPLLTGINFKIDDNNLECTATDSYRLARRSITITENKEKINIVIPSKNLIELVKTFDDHDGKLEMHIFTNKIIFKFDSIIFQSRLLNGTYPDTSRLIPQEFKSQINTLVTDIYNVIDRASLLTSEKDKNIVNLESKENIIIITSNSPEIGKVEEKLEVESKKTEEIKISFSARYMLEALKATQSEKVNILFNGESNPIILKSEEVEGLIQLILPIRTY